MQKLNLFIRSSIFSSYTIISAIIWSLVCSACFFLPLSYRYKLVSLWTDSIIKALKLICHVNYQVTGWENIPKKQTGIIICKHQSTWETFFLPGQFKELAIILKKELLWIPFFGWGLAEIDPIAINRNKASTAMEQIINKGKKCLAAGRWILVFPEGTRIAPGKVGKYRLGGARLAVATGHPVLPIAHNAGCFWPRKGFIKKPGTVQVVIGPLIETQNRTPEEVLKEAKNWIEATMLKLVE